jgi:hypothetical protein
MEEGCAVRRGSSDGAEEARSRKNWRQEEEREVERQEENGLAVLPTGGKRREDSSHCEM